MPQYRTFPIPRLLGLNEDENHAAVGDHELTISLNSYRRGRTKGTRPGLQRDPDIYTSSMTGPIQGIAQFYRANGAARDVVVIENGNIRENTSGTLNGALTLNTTALWTFAAYQDRIYGAGGALDDDFWYWDGAAASVTAVPILNLSATAIYPAYVFQKWNRLWAAGFRVAAGTLASDLSSNQTTVRYSDLAAPTTWPTGNTIGGTSTIGGLSAYGNEWVTGFGEFTDNNGDWLLILTNIRLYAVSQTGDSLSPFSISARGTIANGCVHQNAFVTLGLDSGDAIYLSERGIHSLRQSEEFGARSETFLSWKIRRTFETINHSAITKSVAAYDPTKGLVIFFVPTGSSTAPDTGFVLDVKDKKNLTSDNAEWDIWRLGGSGNEALVTAMATCVDATGQPTVHFGTAGGDICHLNDAIHADLGSPYRVHFRTKHNDYGELSYDKHNGDIWITMQPGGDYTPTFKQVFDFGVRSSSPKQLRMAINAATWSSEVWSNFNWADGIATVQTKVYGMGAGQTIAYDFDHSAANEPFYIANLAPEVAILGEQGQGAGGE